MTDRSEGTNNSDGTNEPVLRAIEAKQNGEAFLSALLSLIEREADRTGTSFDHARICLANGTDPGRVR